MIDQSRLDKGLYWQQSWKLVEGCTKVSPGCDNCWSETETAMRSAQKNEKISGRAKLVINPLTNCFDDTHMRVDNLDLPLRTKKPTVFAIWNDLFHVDVSDQFRTDAYRVMARCPQHTFLILTKRAAQMAEFFLGRPNAPNWAAQPNIWHGVTVENQEQADLRIPRLLKVLGKRFVSIEPMIGLVDLNVSMRKTDSVCDWCGGFVDSSHDCYEPGLGIDAVLLGGESGKNARPIHPEWVRSIRDQCEAAEVPFFFKQWGEWRHFYEDDPFPLDIKNPAENIRRWNIPHRGFSARVGKKKAGRTLYGKLYNDLPWLLV